MRKIHYFISVAAIALGLASCNKEEIDSAKGPLTIIADTESGIDTKTSLSGDDATGYQVLWSEGDEISTREGYKFILTEGAGTTRGTFVAEDEIEDGAYYIFYATNGRNLTNVSKYKNSCTITSAPMKAEVTIENGVVTSVTEFKNMCGLLRLTLKGSGTVKEVKVIDNDEPLYGRIDDFKDDPISVEYTSYVGDHALIQDCGEGVVLSDEGVDFYFPVPPGDYHAIRIEINDFFGHTVIKTLKSTSKLSIARALITPVNISVNGLDKKPDVPAGSLFGEFTVNAEGRTVYFSKGNLYWDGNSFKFLNNQYDHTEVWDRSHVEHFFWHHDASYAYKSNILGYASDQQVLFTNDPSDAVKANPDFTVNGVQGKYRTLSSDEWNYLIGHNSRKWVTVEGVEGYVIAPDGVTLADDKDAYTSDELEVGNLVFLPFAGLRLSGTVNPWALLSCYWASNRSGNPYCLAFDNGNFYVGTQYSTDGSCIRLVTDKVEDSSL